MATELNAELRSRIGGGTSRRMHSTEQVAAVLYGKGLQNKTLAVKRSDVDKVLKTKLGANTLIELKVAADANYTVLIKDIQGNAISRALTHVDFWHVKPDQEVEVDVAVHLEGKAPGVTAGGILEQISHTVLLTCKANAIPEELKVDVSHLELNKNIHLAAVKLPEGTRVRAGYNPTLVAVVEEKAVVEETPVAVEGAPAEGAAAPAVGADGKPVAAAVGKDGKPVVAAAATGKDGKPVAAAKDAKGAAPAAGKDAKAAAPAKGGDKKK